MTAGSAVFLLTVRSFRTSMHSGTKSFPWLHVRCGFIFCDDTITHLGRRTNWNKEHWLPVYPPVACSPFFSQRRSWGFGGASSVLWLCCWGGCRPASWWDWVKRLTTSFDSFGPLPTSMWMNGRLLSAWRSWNPSVAGRAWPADEAGNLVFPGKRVRLPAGKRKVDFLNLIRGHVGLSARRWLIQAWLLHPILISVVSSLVKWDPDPSAAKSRMSQLQTLQRQTGHGQMTHARIADPHIVHGIGERREDETGPVSVPPVSGPDTRHEASASTALATGLIIPPSDHEQILQSYKAVIVGAGPAGLEQPLGEWGWGGSLKSDEPGSPARVGSRPIIDCVFPVIGGVVLQPLRKGQMFTKSGNRDHWEGLPVRTSSKRNSYRLGGIKPAERSFYDDNATRGLAMDCQQKSLPLNFSVIGHGSLNPCMQNPIYSITISKVKAVPGRTGLVASYQSDFSSRIEEAGRSDLWNMAPYPWMTFWTETNLMDYAALIDGGHRTQEESWGTFGFLNGDTLFKYLCCDLWCSESHDCNSASTFSRLFTGW